MKNEQNEGDKEKDVNETTSDMEGKSTAPEKQNKNGDN